MRFDRVIIVNPPSPPGYTANKESHGGLGQMYPRQPGTMPPLDLPYLVGYLDSRGVPLEVLEAEGLELSVEQVAERVGEIAPTNGMPRTLVVVRTSAPSLDWDLSACTLMKQATRGIRVGIYGAVVPHVRKRLEREDCLDYILQGEPDFTVYDLVSDRPENQIPGVTYRLNGNWVENPPRPFERDLDKLPFPKWELLPYHKYAIPRSSNAGHLLFLPMLTSRGCPFGCHYCPYPVAQGLPWRFRSPKNVVDEIEHLVRDLSIEYILFRDPMFSMRLDRVNQICAEIQRRGLVFKWKCETRPDCLNEETIRAMAAAGCDGINFGVESSEPEIQANVGRKVISREKIIEMTGLCRKYGIKTFCFFIVGLPGDTVETILETVKFAIRLRPNWLQFNAAAPLLGTKIREWAVARGLAAEGDYVHIDSYNAMMGNENLDADQVESLHRFAKLIEGFLNRRGILKDWNRQGFLYRQGTLLADWASDLAGRTAFAIGQMRFRQMGQASESN